MTTKEQVIELAKQAGLPFNKYCLIGCDTCECDMDDELERFATLVRNAALEDAAQKCKEVSSSDENKDSWTITRFMAMRKCADAIRNMKDNT